MTILESILYLMNTDIITTGVTGMMIAVITAAAIARGSDEEFFRLLFPVTVTWASIGVNVHLLFILASGVIFTGNLVGIQGFSTGRGLMDLIKSRPRMEVKEKATRLDYDRTLKPSKVWNPAEKLEYDVGGDYYLGMKKKEIDLMHEINEKGGDPEWLKKVKFKQEPKFKGPYKHEVPKEAEAKLVRGKPIKDVSWSWGRKKKGERRSSSYDRNPSGLKELPDGTFAKVYEKKEKKKKSITGR